MNKWIMYGVAAFLIYYFILRKKGNVESSYTFQNRSGESGFLVPEILVMPDNIRQPYPVA